MTEKDIYEIVGKVEHGMNYQFGSDEIERLVKHTERKCELCGKSNRYAELMLETELKDYVIRQAINGAGAAVINAKSEILKERGRLSSVASV